MPSFFSRTTALSELSSASAWLASLWITSSMPEKGPPSGSNSPVFIRAVKMRTSALSTSSSVISPASMAAMTLLASVVPQLASRPAFIEKAAASLPPQVGAVTQPSSGRQAWLLITSLRLSQSVTT